MTAKPAFADRQDRRPPYVIEDQDGLTDIVVRAMSGAENARQQQVAAAFVRHMHAFAREVRLTEDELHLGIDFLNRIGQASHDAHNEGVLFSDAIGLSTLVCLTEQRPGWRNRNRGRAARSVLAHELAAHRERRLDRPQPDAGRGVVRILPRDRSERHADRWRRDRRLAGIACRTL